MPVDDSRPRNAAVEEAMVRLERAREGLANVTVPHLQSYEALGNQPDLATLQLVASAAREIAPRHVIEFGSGATTELLALLGFEQGRMAVTAFEHDPWAAREFLAVANPFAVNYRWFAFCLCPLVARRCHGELAPIYDDGMTTPTVPYPADLIVIEGPPRALGGRAGTIYQALTYARIGTLILLLDFRPDDSAMVEAWTQELAAQVRLEPPGMLERHLAFVVTEPLATPYNVESPRAQDSAAASRTGLESS